MTEQKETSAVVEETGDAVDTAPQAHTAESQKGNKTSLTLSVIAIAIALAAGAGMYGLMKKQDASQNSTNEALVNQVTALQNAQASQKAALEAVIKQQSEQLAAAKQLQAGQAKQLDELQQKSPPSPAAMPKHGCWRRPIFWLSSPGASCGAIRT